MYSDISSADENSNNHSVNEIFTKESVNSSSQALYREVFKEILHCINTIILYIIRSSLMYIITHTCLTKHAEP